MKSFKRMFSMLMALVMLSTMLGLAETAREVAPEEAPVATEAEEPAPEEPGEEPGEEPDGEPAPEETIPEEDVPEEDVPEETVPEETVPEEGEGEAAPEVVIAPEWEYDAEIGAITIPYAELPEALRFEWTFAGAAKEYAVQLAPVPEGDAPEERGERIYTQEPWIELPAADYAEGGWFSLYVIAVLEDGTEIEGWKYFRLEQRIEDDAFDLAQVNAGTYNYQAAIQYSYDYSGNGRHRRADGTLAAYNTNYERFDNLNMPGTGDCCNFVSQCLTAGGLPPTADWQPYTSAWKANKTFIRAFAKMGYNIYVRNSSISVSGVTPKKTSIAWEDIREGDVIFTTGLHAQLVTRKAVYGSNYCVYVSAHTWDACGCPKCNDMVYYKTTGTPQQTIDLVVSIRGGVNGKGDGTTTENTPKVPVTGLTLSRSSSYLDLSQSFTMTATVSPSNASNRNVKWSASNNKVKIQDLGGNTVRVWAMEPGTATITCTSADNSGIHAQSTVNVYTPTKLQITGVDYPANFGIKAGGWTLNYGTVYSPFGLKSLTTDIQNSKGVSLTKKTASISGVRYDVRNFDSNVLFGYVARAGVGSYTWILTAEDQTGSRVSLSMPMNAVNSSSMTIANKSAYASIRTTNISLSKTELNMVPGDKETLIATVQPSYADNKSVTWTSNNTAVATVSNGTVSAVGQGTAIITCAANDGGSKMDCFVSVVDEGLVSRIELNVTEVEMAPGTSMYLVPTIYPSTARNTKLEWDADGIGVFVEDDGLVLAVWAGETSTVYCRATDGSGVFATCHVTVQEPPKIDPRVRLSEYSLTLNKATGDTAVLEGKVVPGGTENRVINWSVTPSDVLEIQDMGLQGDIEQTGQLKLIPKAAGTATITATPAADNGVPASCQVTVLDDSAAPRVTYLHIQPTQWDRAGSSGIMDFEMEPSNLPMSVLHWESSNPEVVEVEMVENEGPGRPHGYGLLINPLTPGEATITGTATDGSGWRAVCKFTVIEEDAPEPEFAFPTDLQLSCEQLKMKAGESVQVQSTVLPADALQFVDYSVDDDVYTRDTVVKVDPFGKITAIGVGEATIIAQTLSLPDENGEYHNVVKEIHVEVVADDLAPVRAKKLALDRTSLSIKAGQSETLEAQFTPSNVEDTRLSWSSDDEEVATVEDGKVQALRPGTAQIMATALDTSLVHAICNVTVTEGVPVTEIQLSTNALYLETGDIDVLTATILPQEATDTRLRWTSDNEQAVTVEDGVIEAVGAGVARITCASLDGNGAQAVCEVHVSDPVLIEEIELTPQEISLSPGGKWLIEIEAFPEDASNLELHWESLDEEVATVSDYGLITAEGLGDTKIVCSACDGGGAQAMISVSVVEEVKVTGIELNESELSLKVGETADLVATVSPQGATNQEVSWSSVESTIAEVSPEGKVTAMSAGQTEIVCAATDDSGVEARCTVIVSEGEPEPPEDVPVSEIQLSQSNLKLNVGESETLTATVLPQGATNKEVSWSSVEPGIAEVNQEGVVTAKGQGITEIICEATDGSGVRASCIVDVDAPEPPKDIKVQEIELSQQSLSLKVGDTADLVATVSPQEATNQVLHWSSESDEVAEVDETGHVTAKGQGQTEIVCAATDDSGVEARCTVIVSEDEPEPPKDIKVQKIELEPKSLSLKVGGIADLVATVSPQEATNKEVRWSSVESTIAEVSPEGKVTAMSAGQTEIICAATDDSGVEARCTVVVSEDEPEPPEDVKIQRIELEPESLTMWTGDKVKLTPKIYPENATKQEVTWLSTKSLVAEVNAQGEVTARGSGEGEIICLSTDGSNVEARCKVKVYRLEPVSSIGLSHKSLRIQLGTSATLTATVYPASATRKDLVWSSDNEEVATVEGGVIQALSLGDATITCAATDGSDVKASCSASVTEEKLVTGIELNETEITLQRGERLQLSATVSPDDAVNTDVVWKTELRSVAEVSQDGWVLGVDKGTAKIFCSAADGSSAQAICKVTVLPGSDGSEVVTQVTANTDVIYTGETAYFTVVTTDPSNYLKLSTGKGSRIYNEQYKATGSFGLERTGWDVNYRFDEPGEYDLEWSAREEAGFEYGMAFVQHVTVVDRPVESVELNEAELSLMAGAEATLEASVAPDNAVNRALNWRIDGEAVAFLDDGEDNGVRRIEAVAPGEATITCAAADGSGASAQCHVVVEANGLLSAQLKQESISLVEGETGYIDIVTEPQDAHRLFEGRQFEGASYFDDSELFDATLTEDGRIQIHALAEGVAQVKFDPGVRTAAGEALDLGFGVTVAKAAKPKSVSVSAASKTLNLGETLQLTAGFKPAGAWSKVTWSSSSKKIATVDENGVVHPVKAGSVKITAKAAYGGKKGSIKIKVVDPFLPSKVALDLKGTVRLSKYEEIALFPTIEPANAVSDLTWSSSNKKIATVENGVVTPKKNGTVTITAKTRNGKKASVKVKVFDPFVPEKITITDGKKLTMYVKDSEVLFYEIEPAAARNAEVTWKSSNKKIATVEAHDQCGWVEAIKKGSATITVKTKNGKKASIKITVKK